MTDKQFSTDILTFLRKHVFPIEDHFAAFHYKNVRCFDEYSNTPLEGTNNGLKHCTFGVKGNMTLQHSAANIVQQDNNKLVGQKRKLHSDLHKRRLCDLGDEGGKLIAIGAFGQFSSQVENGHNYASIRTDSTNWVVMRSVDYRNVTTKILPIFERKRVVTWNVSGLVRCDCGYTDRWGIPCRHIAHVIQYYSENRYCFTHHDVDIRWWTINAQVQVISDGTPTEPAEQELQINLRRVSQLQRNQYPIVENFCNFHCVEYRCGKNSNDRFKNMRVGTAIEIFQSSKTLVLNYPESSSTGTCTSSVGFTNTVYFGGDNDAEEGDDNNAEEGDDNNAEEGGDNDAEEGGDNDAEDYDVMQQQRIRAELESRKSDRPVNFHERYGPIFKEIVSSSLGDTLDDANNVERSLRSILSDIKKRRVANVRTNTGNMVTPTLANGSKAYFRHKPSKQKRL